MMAAAIPASEASNKMKPKCINQCDRPRRRMLVLS
jgi:hypothetical protein